MFCLINLVILKKQVLAKKAKFQFLVQRINTQCIIKNQQTFILINRHTSKKTNKQLNHSSNRLNWFFSLKHNKTDPYIFAT